MPVDEYWNQVRNDVARAPLLPLPGDVRPAAPRGPREAPRPHRSDRPDRYREDLLRDEPVFLGYRAPSGEGGVGDVLGPHGPHRARMVVRPIGGRAKGPCQRPPRDSEDQPRQSLCPSHPDRPRLGQGQGRRQELGEGVGGCPRGARCPRPAVRRPEAVRRCPACAQAIHRAVPRPLGLPEARRDLQVAGPDRPLAGDARRIRQQGGGPRPRPFERPHRDRRVLHGAEAVGQGHALRGGCGASRGPSGRWNAPHAARRG